MSKLFSTLTYYDGKPAGVLQDAQGFIQVHDGRKEWVFDKDLTPLTAVSTHGNGAMLFRLGADGLEYGVIFTSAADMAAGNLQPMGGYRKAKSGDMYATGIANALVAIQNVAHEKDFPPEARAELPNAFKRMGIPYTTSDVDGKPASIIATHDSVHVITADKAWELTRDMDPLRIHDKATHTLGSTTVDAKLAVTTMADDKREVVDNPHHDPQWDSTAAIKAIARAARKNRASLPPDVAQAAQSASGHARGA